MLRRKVSIEVRNETHKLLESAKIVVLRILNFNILTVKELYSLKSEGEIKEESDQEGFSVSGQDEIVNFSCVKDSEKLAARLTSFFSFLLQFAQVEVKEAVERLAQENNTKVSSLRDQRDALVTILVESYDLNMMRCLYREQQDFDPFFDQCFVLAKLRQTGSNSDRFTLVSFYCREGNGAAVRELYREKVLNPTPFTENFSFVGELFAISFEAVMKKLIDANLIDDALALSKEICEKIKRTGEDKRKDPDDLGGRLHYPIEEFVAHIVSYLFFKGHFSQGEAFAKEFFGAKAEQVICDYRSKSLVAISFYQKKIADAVLKRAEREKNHKSLQVIPSYFEGILMQKHFPLMTI